MNGHSVKGRTVRRIKQAIHEEKEAIKDYRHNAKKVDPKTAKLMRHIAKDEQHHHKELSKRLAIVSKRK